MNVLWSPNPRKRRRKMSAKQAKFFGGGKRKRRHSRRAKRRTNAVVAVPMVHRRKGRRRSAARVSRRRSGRRASFRTSGAISMLKTGLALGAGGVLVDVAMGQVRGFLPASMQTPTDSAGAPQYGYYAAKAAIAIALGTYGGRLPVVGRYAGTMAEGALGIMAYQFMRPMVPASLSLGAYFNPAPTARPALGRVGAYAQVRSQNSGGAGTRAASGLRMVNQSRQAA